MVASVTRRATEVGQDCLVADYRIDDLARAADTTVRNVRAYQERGLLDPPERRGRVAIYGDAHLARLRLILHLLDRGVTLALIDDLVTAWEGGRNIGELLGLERALLAGDQRRTSDPVDAAALAGFFGTDPDPGDLDRAVALGLLSEHDDGYRIQSPRLVQLGAELASMGLPVATMLDHIATLRGRVSAIADDFVALAVAHLFDDVVADVEHADFADMLRRIERLRPVAKAVVDVELTSALDTAISEAAAETLRSPGDP